jgi:hypothetical protein
MERFFRQDFSDLEVGEAKNLRVELFCRVLQLMAGQAGKPRWCVKDPQVTYHLTDYANAIPDAKFLITVRDPRAVCRSYLDPRGFTVGRPANWIAGAERWVEGIRLQLDFHKSFPDRVMLLNYEDLICYFDDQLSRICEFLDLPIEPQMQRYYEQDSQARIHEGNVNITRRPDPEKIDAWRKSMTDRQIRLVEAIASPVMKQAGYERELSPLKVTGIERAFAKLHDRVISEYRWQRHKHRKKR